MRIRLQRQVQARIARFAAIALLLFTVGCTGAPSGVEPVTGFEIDRYLGKWYEIARLDHPFERGLSRVTADYSLREGGGVAVINRGYNSEAAEWSEVQGKAFFVGEPTTGMLKVSFFGPFYGGYNVIELDQENYQWSMVVGPNRSYLWILARSPELDPAVIEALTQQAEGLGFATGDLIWVEHD